MRQTPVHGDDDREEDDEVETVKIIARARSDVPRTAP
jgi:hypothetical protein